MHKDYCICSQKANLHEGLRALFPYERFRSVSQCDVCSEAEKPSAGAHTAAVSEGRNSWIIGEWSKNELSGHTWQSHHCSMSAVAWQGASAH